MKHTKLFNLSVSIIFVSAVVLGGVFCSEESNPPPPPPPENGDVTDPFSGSAACTGNFSVASGCATYVGLHPTEPGASNENNQTFELCADGTASKSWNPAPVSSPTTPGVIDSTGTWTHDGSLLTIDTSGTIMNGAITMQAIETYRAFTYDGGSTLSIYNTMIDDVTDDSGIIGQWTGGFKVETVMSGMMSAEMDAITNDVLTVYDDGTWTQARTINVTCTGEQMICGMYPTGSDTEETNGTWDSTSYERYTCTEGDNYLIQITDTLALELQ